MCHHVLNFINNYKWIRQTSLSTLTGIYFNKYIRGVESTFAIIAEPNRRAILSLLATSERSVGDLERQLRMPQTSVSKHLRVLREAGFVVARVDAQRRMYRIRPEPLMEVDAWLAPFRQFWTKHVDALERHLDRMDPLLEPEASAEPEPPDRDATPMSTGKKKLPKKGRTDEQP